MPGGRTHAVITLISAPLSAAAAHGRFAPIDGAGKTISSILTCKLYREDNAVTGDVLMYQVDLHILADSHGSRLEYTK